MKKFMLSTAIILLGTVAFAQERASVLVQDFRIERLGAEVQATFSLINPKGGPNSYKVVVTPVLTDGDQSLDMPDVVFRTTKGRITDFRKQVDYFLPTVVAGWGEVVAYSYRFAYKSWMNHAQLLLEVRLSGCDREVTEPAVILSSNLSLPPTAPYVVKPVLAYQPSSGGAPQVESRSAFLLFKVGRSELLEGYMSNGVELAKIDRSLAASDRKVDRITLWGSCSPEGTFPFNVRLAGDRASVVEGYLRQRYPGLGVPIEVRSTAENWAGLVSAMSVAMTPWSREVIAIASSDLSDEAKDRQVRLLNSGATFDYLLAEVYPALRRVNYTVHYAGVVGGVGDVDLLNRATKALSAGDLAQARLLLADVTGRTGYYYNTLGVLQLLEGDYDGSGLSLERALGFGIDDARLNLVELDLKLRNMERLSLER